MSLSTKVWAAIFAAWIFNFAIVKLTGYPVVWCVADATLRPVLAPWASLALLALCLYLGFVMIAGRGFLSAVQVIAMMVLVAGAGGFAETLFKLGGSCG